MSDYVDEQTTVEVADKENDSSTTSFLRGCTDNDSLDGRISTQVETFKTNELPEVINLTFTDNKVNDLNISAAKEDTGRVSETRQDLLDNKELNEVAGIRCSVQNFYKKYNPEKLNTIDNILLQYIGFEIQLVLHLIQKYNATDQSDLDIFAGSLSEKEFDEVAGHQMQLRNVIPLINRGSDGEKEDHKDSSPIKMQQNLESLKGSINGHIESAKQSLISSNIQDISNNFAGRFLTSWNTATTTSAATSSTKPNASASIPSPLSPMAYTKDEINTPANVKIIQPSIMVCEELSQASKLATTQAEVQSLEASKTHLNNANRALKLQVVTWINLKADMKMISCKKCLQSWYL